MLTALCYWALEALVDPSLRMTAFLPDREREGVRDLDLPRLSSCTDLSLDTDLLSFDTDLFSDPVEPLWSFARFSMGIFIVLLEGLSSRSGIS